MSLHYQHSGAAPLFGVALTFLAGALTAAVGGFVYDYAVVWIPFIYISFLLTLCFGALIGIVVGACAIWAHIRNRLAPTVIGLMSGVIGVYVSWCVDMVARGAIEDVSAFSLLFEPETLSSYVSLFYEQGAWSIGKNGQNVTGMFLAAVWIVEAGVIVCCATALPWSMLSGKAYCEDCGVWCDDENDVQRLSVKDLHNNVERLNAGDLSVLSRLDRAASDAEHFLRLDLIRCPSCDNCNCLSVTEVTIHVDSDGDRKETTTTHVNKLMVLSSDLPALREAGKPLPETPTDLSETHEPSPDDDVDEQARE